mmetsp:Transcript_26156/g.34376  ORF Transcript_26156/g.34376 Transcript_26156/m.34376 type:complete len:585 (-) Transcript_26156:116-1870(-)
MRRRSFIFYFLTTSFVVELLHSFGGSPSCCEATIDKSYQKPRQSSSLKLNLSPRNKKPFFKRQFPHHIVSNSNKEDMVKQDHLSLFEIKGGSEEMQHPAFKGDRISKRTTTGIVGLNVLLVSALCFKTFVPANKAIGEVDYAFFLTTLACIVLTSAANAEGIGNFVNKGREKTKEMLEFSKFQRRYLLVHLISAFTDFMQGAYLYMIYDTYGYSMQQTALLYLSGFLSSLLVGFSAGGLVDKYGRKRSVIVHLVLNAIQCLILSVNNYKVLLFGRIISGIATSLLMTSYECWMVSEHSARGFPSNLLGGTFSSYVFGMGAVAVLSGVVAGGLVERGLGVTSPFNFCALVSVVNILLVMTFWNENYGDATASAAQNVHKAFQMIFRNPKVTLVGLIQSLFEGVMMVFVFMWTPVLRGLAAKPLNLGLIFATFMVSVMVGSSVFKLLTDSNGPVKMEGEPILFGALALGVGSMLVSALKSATLPMTLIAFILFELSVGVYFPVIGTMRASAIPEDIRATVMNIFRILLNGIVVVMLLGPVGAEWGMEKKKAIVYSLCAAGLGIATVAQGLYIKLSNRKFKTMKDSV